MSRQNLHPLMDGIGGRITAVLEKVKLPKKSSFWLILHKIVAAQI